jgi:hypothetical protein
MYNILVRKNKNVQNDIEHFIDEYSDVLSQLNVIFMELTLESMKNRKEKNEYDIYISEYDENLAYDDGDDYRIIKTFIFKSN